MGSVWCKADKAQHRSFSPKLPFTSAISRWTSQVCQAYRRPRDIHRSNIPPPQKPPPRSSERLSISNPRLVEDTNGWQTATLFVPENAPIPPPRKKKRRIQELERMALSMDELNRSSDFDQAFLRSNRIRSEESLLTFPKFDVTEVSEVEGYEKWKRMNDKENHIPLSFTKSIDRLDRNPDFHNVLVNKASNHQEIVLAASRNETGVDKSVDIYEVPKKHVNEEINLNKIQENSDTSSRFIGGRELDYSDRSDTIGATQEINYVSRLPDSSDKDVKIWKDENKKVWMQNILSSDLKLGSERNVLEPRRNSETTFKRKVLGGDRNCGEPNSLPYDRLHLMHVEEGTAVPNSKGNKTPPSTPEMLSPDNSRTYDNEAHSVLLEILKRNKNASNDSEINNNGTTLEQKSKSNFIYKSTTNENVLNDSLSEPTSSNNSFYEINSLKSFTLTPPSLRHSKSPNSLSNILQDYNDRIKLVDYSSENSKSLDRDIKGGLTNKTGNIKLGSNRNSYVSALRELDFVKSPKDNEPEAITSKSTTLTCTSTNEQRSKHESCIMSADNRIQKTEIKQEKFNTKESILQDDDKNGENYKDSRRSSKSSITDSLHEFEMSIYDMLKESNIENQSSDEGESVKTKHNKIK